ncbi:MAG: glycosyltransferase family 4 protein [Methanothrix sp.]|nr:glycosyltransferase family 4 protein [Methanothrix sp.]
MNGRDKKRITFVYFSPNSSFIPSFVERDYRILSNHFECSMVSYRKLIDTIKIFKSILFSKASISWFAGGHAFLSVVISRILRKKSIIIIGGYEVASEAEIGYGLFLMPWHKRVTTLIAIKYADMVLPVSEFTSRETLRRIRPRKMQIIYNGVNEERFKPGTSGKEEDLVITVAIIDRSNLKRKGLLTLVKAAALIPEARFAIIGMERDESADHLKSISPQNVLFPGFVSNDALIEWYQRAKVYVQISAYESFGVSLAEAMLCECVPVVTKSGALPEVVGETGFYVAYDDERDVAEGIKKALKSEKGALARERVSACFSDKKRERELVSVIGELIL